MNPAHLSKAIFSKSSLAVSLSRLKSFESPKMRLEQYPTDSEVAAGALWNASLLGDIEGKTVADLGCGTGMLGIGALILGAKKVWFVDVDSSAIRILNSNLEEFSMSGGFDIMNCGISDFKKTVDVVLQNPPFGTKEEHADRQFLEAAFRLSAVIYSFHKSSTKRFIRSIAADSGFKITHEWDFSFPLKNTMDFHKKRLQRIAVTCFRLEKIKNLQV